MPLGTISMLSRSGPMAALLASYAAQLGASSVSTTDDYYGKG
jgi:hypothetical protein